MNVKVAPVQQTATYHPISPAAQTAYSNAEINSEVEIQGPRKAAVVFALRHGGNLLGSMVSNLSKKKGDLY
jgi:hypothetical protein